MAGLAGSQQATLHSQLAALLTFELPDVIIGVEIAQPLQSHVLKEQRS